MWRGPSAWIKTEQRAGSRLPYARHLDDDTILLDDGSIMTSLHFAGLPFETEDADFLNHCQNVRETILRSSLDARFIIYHHVIRRKVDANLNSHFDGIFAQYLDEKWKERHTKRPLFVNELFITIVRRPPRGKIGILEKIQKQFSPNGNGDNGQNILRELKAAIAGFIAAFGQYGVRIIGCYKHEGLKYSESLEFLSALYNGEMRPVLFPQDNDEIGYYLPYKRVSFGLDAIETRGAGDANFAAILSLKEYPAETRAGVLDDVCRLPCEFVLTESFAPADRQIAKERIELSLRRLKAADEDAISEKRELLLAKDRLVNGQTGFGMHHLSLCVRENSMAALDKVAASAAAALADFGAIAVREDINLEPAFWAQFPGNEGFIARSAMVSTDNIASLISLHSFPIGQADDNHWGQALSVFETTSATPYFFNFHEADLGNFTIIGPSGSGKTVVMNFLTAQAQKYSPKTIIFDKDRGAEIFVRALEGEYSVLRNGIKTGFNPLKLEDNPINRGFLRDWLACLLAPNQGTLSAADMAIITNAIDANYEQDYSLRNLKNFAELLGGQRRAEDNDLSARIVKWIDNNEYAWLFANDEDILDLSAKIIGFDMSEILDSPILRTPTMMYLFLRIEERINGEPTIILIDEGWKALDDNIFAARIRDWMKTLRKRNAILGFGTQSARDALESRVATAIVEQTATQIFMPNPRARAEDYCEGFGLSEHELSLIKALPFHSRCFLVRKANHSVVVRLDLGEYPQILNVLSGREASVRKLDKLRAELGDAPSLWFKHLTGTEWPKGGA